MQLTNANRTILVVEDDQDIRESLQEVLSSEGYQVRTARHGLDALQQLRSSATLPNLILLDLMMPVMDGRSFLKQIQEENPTQWGAIPVVLISASGEAMHPDLETASTLRKPIDLESLFEVVQQNHC